MLLRIVCFLTLFGFSSLHAAFFESDYKADGPVIKVLVANHSQGVMIETVGEYKVFNTKTGKEIGTRILSKRQFMQPLTEGLKWSERFPDVFQIALRPNTADTTFIVDGIQYRGSILVFQVQGTLSIVNEVSVEDYVRSVLSAKLMNASGELLDKEVLAALAIATRTEAMYAVTRGKDSYWHITSDEAGYMGEGVTMRRAGIEEAVALTRHFALRQNHSNMFFDAKWTENSAGRTAPFYVMFHHELGAKDEGLEIPYVAQKKEESIWSATVPVDIFLKRTKLSSLAKIDVSRDGFSHKVHTIRLADDKTAVEMSFLKFQEMVGNNIIQSSDFEVSVQGDTVTFTGVGKGHGVGLCVEAAKKMAEDGHNAREILAQFFPDAQVINVHDVSHGVSHGVR